MKRVYLGNLSYGMKEDKLNEICSAYGTVTSTKVISDRETGRSRGFAFVEMETPEQANALIEALNGKDMDGRKVIAAIAREKELKGWRREKKLALIKSFNQNFEFLNYRFAKQN